MPFKNRFEQFSFWMVCITTKVAILQAYDFFSGWNSNLVSKAHKPSVSWFAIFPIAYRKSSLII